MIQTFSTLPQRSVSIHAGELLGPFEWWRHALGHGGINLDPLPDTVIPALQVLKPRLIRTFIQEYFHIYPERGRFDWSKLDPYMDSLAAVGGTVAAAITIKPRPLYPEVNEKIVFPNDWAEWQEVIYRLVRRYSVEKSIVTYWEIGNEVDIGEIGGSPYLFQSPEDYIQYYEITAEAILRAYPEAKIGGPALADSGNPIMAGLIEYCARQNISLDFVSWHVYSNNPGNHQGQVERIKRELLKHYPLEQRPEMMVTEWNRWFDPVSVPEQSHAPERSALIAAAMIAMSEAGLDWSCYYHVWDQTAYIEQFKPFFADPAIMTKHWNEFPHRFGMFGVEGEVRPQYLVYAMLAGMEGQRSASSADDTDLRVCASVHAGGTKAMIVNYHAGSSRDVIAAVRFTGLKPGKKRLKCYRIDGDHRPEGMRSELIPVEVRGVDIADTFSMHWYCPANSVSLIALEDLDAEAGAGQ